MDITNKTSVINHIENSINYISKLNDDILNIHGMSGVKTRHFYNNLCSIDNIKLLEIGVWTGSTTCSLMYKNNISGFCIDNFSQSSGKSEFFKNFNKYLGNNRIKFIEKNCWELNNNDFQNLKFNLYIFDGPHTKIDHYKGLNNFIKYMDNYFIYIVDDWNWLDVRVGTNVAIKLNNLEIIYKKFIFTNKNNKHPRIENCYQNSNWHNGIAIFYLKKI
jgi:hypothetical protein